MIRLLVDDREDKIKNNISFEPDKKSVKYTEMNLILSFLVLMKTGVKFTKAIKTVGRIL